MAVTRSANKQAHLEDFTTTTDSKATKEPKPSRPSKRKAATTIQPTEAADSKKPKTTTPSESKPKPKSKSSIKSPITDQHQPSSTDLPLPPPITINRAPVLHLWAACVTATLHPDLSWQACINIGSAIASLCAVSKGKAIGMIEPKDRDEQQEREKQERKEKAREGARTVEVMGFKLPMKGEKVVLSGKETSAKEEGLRGKFGGEEGYEPVREVMMEMLGEREGRKGELGADAFGMYEKFRPGVPRGQKGWGRKGELDLERVRDVVRG